MIESTSALQNAHTNVTSITENENINMKNYIMNHLLTGKRGDKEATQKARCGDPSCVGLAWSPPL